MLNNTTMKRISKELERDFKEFTYNCIIYHPNHRGLEINLMLDNQQEVQFKLTPEYPFKPPCLFVNDMHYIDRHKYFYNKNKKQLKKYNSDFGCPCCDTIVCNWSPGNTLHQILNEYLIREDKYNKIKHILMFNIIKTQLPFDDCVITCISGYIQ
tara:strand:+ start:8603 stop:9067 length:465 start_codon:yes stop_codon:yes gene_type:complete